LEVPTVLLCRDAVVGNIRGIVQIRIIGAVSVGIPADLRDIIEGGSPEGIISTFDDLFSGIEEATHLRATEVMQELGWSATP
jgi:hypothetical protein